MGRSFLVLTLLMLLLGLYLPVNGQNAIALENSKRAKRIIFYPGDLIRFKTTYSDQDFHGIIEGLNDSTLILVNLASADRDRTDQSHPYTRNFVPLADIKIVFPPYKTGWDKFRNLYYGSTMAGGSLTVTGSVIHSFIENQVPDLEGLAIVSGLMTSGLLLKYLGRNKYKVGKRWKLRAFSTSLEERPPALESR